MSLIANDRLPKPEVRSPAQKRPRNADTAAPGDSHQGHFFGKAAPFDDQTRLLAPSQPSEDAVPEPHSDRRCTLRHLPRLMTFSSSSRAPPM